MSVGDFVGGQIRSYDLTGDASSSSELEFGRGAGFVDGNTVIAAVRGATDGAQHWVFGSDPLMPLGRLSYPGDYVDEQDTEDLTGLGDGTWLTSHTGHGGRLRRWKLATSELAPRG